MPMKPKKPCRHPGCPKLTDGLYCEEHEALHRGDRASSSKRGYNRQWQKARARYLKAHPLCVQCLKEGHAVTATVVDHIRPHRGDPVLFWDEKNWQSLCKPCHEKRHGTKITILSIGSDGRTWGYLNLYSLNR